MRAGSLILKSETRSLAAREHMGHFIISSETTLFLGIVQPVIRLIIMLVIWPFINTPVVDDLPRIIPLRDI